MKKEISVIITTKNEEKNLPNLLESLKIQSYRGFETIVVDNNSSDNTKDIAINYGAFVFNQGPERSSQRNFGVSKAKGKFVLILDADMILQKEVLEECVHQFNSDNELKTITIKEIPIGKNFWSKCKKLELDFYSANPLSKTHAARFFDKKVFEEFGGYDLNLTGPEDWDLPERINEKYKKKYFTKSAIFHNEGDYGLFRILQKKFYYAQKASVYISKHSISIFNPKFMYFLRPEFYKNSNLWFRDPVESFGLIFLLLMETISGSIGYFYGKFKK
jgi:glycosyltransferase involved in cell wall biosynthesis